MTTDPDTSSFGGRLAEAIRLSGMTQTALAEQIGVSANTICSWKGNTYQPSHKHLTLLAQALKTSVGVLAGETPTDAEEGDEGSRAAAPSRQGVPPDREDLDLLGALQILQGARPQLHQLADGIPDLITLLSEAEEGGTPPSR